MLNVAYFRTLVAMKMMRFWSSQPPSSVKQIQCAVTNLCVMPVTWNFTIPFKNINNYAKLTVLKKAKSPRSAVNLNMFVGYDYPRGLT